MSLRKIKSKNDCFFISLYIMLSMILGLNGCKTEDKNKLAEDKKTDTLSNLKTEKDSLDIKVGIDITGKEFQPASASDPKNYVVIIYKLMNNTNKKIKGVEADVMIFDLNGDEIKKLKIFDNELMAAGAEKKYRGLYSFNAFSDKDVKLKDIDLKNMKFESKVMMIIYEDGSKETRD